MLKNAIKSRFVSDYKLPIQLIQEPYFSYFIELYNEQYKTKEKLDLLLDAINYFGEQEEFLEYYYQIRDKIIFQIQHSPAYYDFTMAPLGNYDVPDRGFSQNHVFIPPNIGRTLLSIDLTNANYQALKWVNPEIVLNTSTYAKMVQKFTGIEYFSNSKYLRQVIFGALNPKRQVKIERAMTEQILILMLSKGFDNKILSVSADEVVIDVSTLTLDNSSAVVYAEQLKKEIEKKLGFITDVEIYKLNAMQETYYVKEFISQEGYELKCIPIEFHAQIFKHYNKMPLTEYDLCFYYQKQVASFMEALNIKE